MTHKHTKGYTKSIMGQMTFAKLNAVLNTSNPMFKDPNEPLDKWITRKADEFSNALSEQQNGGMDEQGANRKEGNPKS